MQKSTHVKVDPLSGTSARRGGSIQPKRQPGDGRLSTYYKAIVQLTAGKFQLDLPIQPLDDVGKIGLALQDLARTLTARAGEAQRSDRISAFINEGLLLEDILEKVYLEFQTIIPYNRIGLALIDADHKTVTAHWAKTDQPEMHINKGYSAPLAGSSLDKIIRTGKPRILNDLEEYLSAKPDSQSTRFIVAEGIRSSLTCPLVVNGTPVGFIFFSSIHPGTYTHIHVGTFMKIAAQLSVIVEKGRLTSELVAQKNAVEQQHKELAQLSAMQKQYMQHTALITAAAEAVEKHDYSHIRLESVAAREDALGTLARVFQKMSQEVHAREKNLEEHLQRLRFEIDEEQRARHVALITDNSEFEALKKKANLLRSQRG